MCACLLLRKPGRWQCESALHPSSVRTRGERLILVSSFRRPGLLSSLILSLWCHRTSWWEHTEAKTDGEALSSDTPVRARSQGFSLSPLGPTFQASTSSQKGPSWRSSSTQHVASMTWQYCTTCDAVSILEHRCTDKDLLENVSEVTESPKIVWPFSFSCLLCLVNARKAWGPQPLLPAHLSSATRTFSLLFSSSPKGEVSFAMHAYSRGWAHTDFYCWNLHQ